MSALSSLSGSDLPMVARLDQQPTAQQPQSPTTAAKYVNPQMPPSPWMSYRSFPDPSTLHICLVVYSLTEAAADDPAIASVRSPISNCQVTALVVLKNDKQDAAACRAWLTAHRVENAARVCLAPTPGGWEWLMTTPQQRTTVPIDALYLIVPPEQQHNYIMAALHAKLHVLLNDPISTPYAQFVQQLQAARDVSKFLQFKTMFVHQHRVATFLKTCQGFEERISHIHAKLWVHPDQLALVGGGTTSEQLPSWTVETCIRRLGRYCVLVSVLLLHRLKSRPVSAQVLRGHGGSHNSSTSELENNDDADLDHVVAADCVVRFTDDRVLHFTVGHTHGAPTRQVLEVTAQNRIATLHHFVIPHPDGLHTYRVYEKARNEAGKLDIVRGESYDVVSGPPQAVMMWRRFADYCHVMDEFGWPSPQAAGARELAHVSMQTKRILLTLEESLRQGYQEVALVEKDADIV